MSRRVAYFGSVSAFDPVTVLDLVYDMNVDVYSDAGTTPITNGGSVQRMLNQGIGANVYAEELTNKGVWTASGLGSKPYTTFSHGNVLAYPLDTNQTITDVFEAYIVIETVSGTGSAGVQTIFNTEADTGRGYARFDYGGSSRVLVSVGAGAAQASYNFADSTRYIINTRRDGANLVDILVDNASIGTATHAPSFIMSRFLGRADTAYRLYYAGFVSGTLTAGERSNIYSFLDNRF